MLKKSLHPANALALFSLAIPLASAANTAEDEMLALLQEDRPYTAIPPEL